MLKGKTALVTGSTSGIGLATARALAQDGANIVINGFGDKAAIETERAGLEKDFGIKAIYSAADMSKPAEIAEMVATTEKTFGSLDVLVNNAGIQFVANIEDFPPEKWDAIIAINLSSAFHSIHAAMPGMKKRKWGRIINIASAHGLVASPQKVGLRRRQARHRRLEQSGGDRSGQRRRHLQRDLPRLGADAAGTEADRRPRQGLRQIGARRGNRAAVGEAADAPVHQAGEHRRAGGVPVKRRGGEHHRFGLFDRRRLGGAVMKFR